MVPDSIIHKINHNTSQYIHNSNTSMYIFNINFYFGKVIHRYNVILPKTDKSVASFDRGKSL